MRPDRTLILQNRTTSVRRVSPTPRRALWLAMILSAATLGCSTVAGDALFNAATAAGTSVLDQLLTAAINGTLDLFNPPPADEPDDGSDSDGNFEGLTGDAANGQALFAANNCASCHCADATGGCALGAPSLVGVGTTELDDNLRGESIHLGGKFPLFTDQDIVDLESYLASP